MVTIVPKTTTALTKTQKIFLTGHAPSLLRRGSQRISQMPAVHSRARIPMRCLCQISMSSCVVNANFDHMFVSFACIICLLFSSLLTKIKVVIFLNKHARTMCLKDIYKTFSFQKVLMMSRVT